MTPNVKKGLIIGSIIALIVGAYYGYKKWFSKDDIVTGGTTGGGGTTTTPPTDIPVDINTNTNTEPTEQTPPVVYIVKAAVATPIRKYPSDLGEIFITKPIGKVLGAVTKGQYNSVGVDEYVRLAYVPTNISSGGFSSSRPKPTNLQVGANSLNFSSEMQSNLAGNNIPTELYVKKSNVAIVSESKTKPTGMIYLITAQGKG